MSEADHKILEERVAALSGRVDRVEADQRSHRDEMQVILVELKVLQTRVSLYAGLVAAGVSLVAKYLL